MEPDNKEKRAVARILLVRHGESRANAGFATSEPADVPLTDLGHQQALDVADQINETPDLIVVSPEREAASGDVVVARVGGEVTVKRYELRGGSEYLVSQMGPVKIDSKGPQVQILGRVVGLIRSAS